MNNPLTLFKESLIIFKENFLAFTFVVAMGSLGELLLAKIVYSISIYVLVAFIILISLFFVWQSLAILYVTMHHNTKMGVFEPYTETARQIIPFFWVSFLAPFVTFGAFALMIVPGVALLIYLSLSYYTFFFEDKKGLAALERSYHYIKGRWLSVVARIMFLTIIIVVFFFVFTKIASLLLPLSFAKNALGFAVKLLTWPLCFIYFYLIYRDLVMLHQDDGAIDEDLVRKRKSIIKYIGIFGFLAFVTVCAWVMTRTPDSAVRKEAMSDLTPEQQKEIADSQEQYRLMMQEVVAAEQKKEGEVASQESDLTPEQKKMLDDAQEKYRLMIKDAIAAQKKKGKIKESDLTPEEKKMLDDAQQQYRLMMQEAIAAEQKRAKASQ